MNVRKLALTSTAIVALSALSAGHALADSTSATVQAEVVNAASVTINTAPDLGSLTVAGSSGNAVLDPTGDTVNATNDFSTAGGNPASGVATISQSNGSVTVQATFNDMSNTGGTTTSLEATSFSITGLGASTVTGSGAVGDASATGSNAAGISLTGTPSTSTTMGIGVGVAHDAAAALPAGSYEGTFTLTVNNV